MMVLPHQLFVEIPMLQFLKLLQEEKFKLISACDSFTLKFSAHGVIYEAQVKDMRGHVLDREVKIISTDHITRTRAKHTLTDTLKARNLDVLELYTEDATKHFDPFQL